MIIANVNLAEYKIQKSKQTFEPKIDISAFNNDENKKKYAEALNIIEINGNLNPQDKWRVIVSKCKEIGEKILGKVRRTVKFNDPILANLSQMKQKVKHDINAATNSDLKKAKNEELKTIKKQIKQQIKINEENALDKQLEKLSNTKNDSNRYYRVMREMQPKRPKELYVKDENNQMASTEEKQAQLITNYFKNMFAPPNTEHNIKLYPPTEMQIPFTGDEICQAAKSLKNGKSAGADNLQAEYIKYACPTIHNHISEIYNTVAKTGENLEELKLGILTPTQKPNKKKGPMDHLRPIMLLSVLRKILTICIIKRIWDRLSERIPKEQAAYQGGRSTT